MPIRTRRRKPAARLFAQDREHPEKNEHQQRAGSWSLTSGRSSAFDRRRVATASLARPLSKSLLWKDETMAHLKNLLLISVAGLMFGCAIWANTVDTPLAGTRTAWITQASRGMAY